MDAQKKVALKKADRILEAGMKKAWAKWGTKNKEGRYSLKTGASMAGYTKDRIKVQSAYNKTLVKLGFKPLGGRFGKK